MRFGGAVYSAHTLVDRSGLEARFARAARHSRLVRLLRVSIPALVATGLTGLFLLTFFNPFRVTANVVTDTDNLVVSGTKITMESPHMSGFSPDQRPYEIWANTAVQDTTDPDQLDLTEPRGKMLMQDLSTMYVESRTGHFANKAQILDLYKEVYMQTSTGYEARLNHAQIDIGKGSVSSDDGVHVEFNGGRVKGDRLRLTERGDVIRFEGNVVMDLDRAPPTQQPAAVEAAPAPTPRAVTPGKRVSAK